MAKRRMFATSIIDSDAFLDMPLSTQALYFHLSMRADDEGFINNPKRISRLVGASDDEIKVLLAKRFIIGFESGIIVIKHWKMHNAIRQDRMQKTSYTEEKALIEEKENGAYTLCQPDGNQMPVKRQPSIGKVRLGKDSIDKVRLEEDFDSFWKSYPRKISKDKALKSFTKIHKELPDINDLIKIIENHKNQDQWQKDDGKFIPHPSTWLNQKRWEDEIQSSANVWDDDEIEVEVEVV